MAVICMTGWEMGHKGIHSMNGGLGGEDITASTVRGSWSTYGFSVGNGGGATILWDSAVGEFYFGIGLYVVNTTTSGTILIFESPSGTDQVLLQLTGGGQLRVARGDGTTLATGSQVLVSQRWYYIEGRFVISDAAGVATIKVNGVQEINASGLDTRMDATYATCDRLSFNAFGGGGYAVDDLYVVDTTGTANTSYLGDVRIKGYFPNAAGDNTTMTPTAGSNYTCVDEKPPNDATDYVYGTGTTEYDLYNIPNTSGATAVKAARLWWRGQKDDATSVNIAPILKCDTDANGTADTEYSGSDVPLSTTWGYYSKIYDQQPDSTNWSPAKIDALQIGVKSR